MVLQVLDCRDPLSTRCVGAQGEFRGLDQVLIEAANELSIEDTEVLKCENCDFESQNPGAFQKHKKSIRQCESCPQMFCGKRSVQNLKSHQKTHIHKPKNVIYVTSLSNMHQI